MKKEERQQPRGPCRIQQLPEGIVMAILSRLVSIKTILNCRRVCKEWSSIISDPQFAHLHLPRSPAGILVKTWEAIPSSRKLDFYQILERAPGSGFGVEKTTFHPKSLPDPEFELINSCNGLLCLFKRTRSSDHNVSLYVCNPMLGECITILPNNNGRYRCGFIGLGFSVGTNEYKVLQTTSLRFHHEAVAEIYTIGTGIWRSIGSVPQTILKGSVDLLPLPFDAFLHGAQHWPPYNKSDFSIFSFNFESEQFRSLPPPKLSHHLLAKMKLRYSSYIHLGQLRGCLLLCINGNWSTEFCLWVMKDYGVQESWTKILVIENLLPQTRFGHMPIMFLSNGEILMSHIVCQGINRRVVRYNQEEKTFRPTTIACRTPLFHPIAYNPSFVSLYNVSKGEMKGMPPHRKFSGRSACSHWNNLNSDVWGMG